MPPYGGLYLLARGKAPFLGGGGPWEGRQVFYARGKVCLPGPTADPHPSLVGGGMSSVSRVTYVTLVTVSAADVSALVTAVVSLLCALAAYLKARTAATVAKAAYRASLTSSVPRT